MGRNEKEERKKIGKRKEGSAQGRKEKRGREGSIKEKEGEIYIDNLLLIPSFTDMFKCDSLPIYFLIREGHTSFGKPSIVHVTNFLSVTPNH